MGILMYREAVFILQGHDDVIKWKYFSVLLALYAGNSPVTGKFPLKGQ